MANTTYITALYCIETSGHSNIEKRIELLKDLFSFSIPIIAFLDPKFKVHFESQTKENIKIIYRPLESFYIYSLLVAAEPPLKLPETRNHQKDTTEFLALMNTKAEFISEGARLCKTEYVAWIDASIFHVLDDKIRIKNHLETRNHKVKKLKIPGPIKKKKALSDHDLESRVQWRYAGGYFICKRAYSEVFLRHTSEILAGWMLRRRLTWEVNVWIDLEQKKGGIEWAYGNHNDSMMLI